MVPAVDRRTFGLAATAVLLTRLPWIGRDYGSDPDSYRVVISARHLIRSGQYEASRLPGYPLYEYLTALSVNAAPWLSNLITALFSVAAFILFALILRSLQIPRALWLAMAFAMVPVIYLSSCCTMDYIPALSFMLAAGYATLRARPVLAGVLLGLAVGCRITSGALLLPLCLWLLMSQGVRSGCKRSLELGATTLLTAAVCYAPVYQAYGTGFFTFFDNDSYPSADVIFARALPQVWGVLGSLALLLWACALPVYHRYARQALSRPPVRHMLIVCATSILLYLVAFLRLPDEAGYLVPLVPWVLIAVGLLTPPRLVAALAFALLCSSWIGFQGLTPSLQGPIVEDARVRESQREATVSVIDAVARLPGRAAVVSGWVLPRLMLALDGDRLGLHRFLYLIEDDEDYRGYLADGWQIYYLPGVDLYESQAHHLDLSELGARELQVPKERQRPASSGE
ncbi:MAG TPA: hypothetical protein VNZ06_01930 [Steroidobacteraceae bacterium]|nr:hypothetical protein [Steroidobacteraceae bacterium]